MDERIFEITNWYNEKLDEHCLNKAEFNNRFTNELGKITLDSIEKAISYGKLCTENDVLNQIGSILINDPEFFNIPDNIADIDKA